MAAFFGCVVTPEKPVSIDEAVTLTAAVLEAQVRTDLQQSASEISRENRCEKLFFAPFFLTILEGSQTMERGLC